MQNFDIESLGFPPSGSKSLTFNSQGVVGLTPARSATFFCRVLIMKYFLWSFSLQLIQEGQLSVSGVKNVRNTG